MLAAFGRKIALAAALGSLAAFGAFASAAGPLESNENPNQRGVTNPLVGGEDRPQFNGGQAQPAQAGRQNSVAPQRVVAGKPVTENAMRPADHEIAEWLLVCNNKEVQLAKLAEQHADHHRVKDFAKQMEADHTKAWQQLEQIAAHTGHGKSSGHATAPHGVTHANAQGDSATVQPTPEQGGLNYLEIHKQVAAQCIATANREMGAKKGMEFDRAYIGSQIGAHYMLIDTNRVLREYASPELQKILDEDTKTAERHLADAHDIMKSLEQK